jgi:predicted nucleotide-binding protein (sugar kinase/HSP70/actin superfamily)
MFYRYFPLWYAFFKELGWRVTVSEGIGKKGKIIYFEDSCLPMKLLITHAVSLKGRVDHLFVPRLVSLHQTYILCPKFRGAPDIVRLATGGEMSIIDETIDLRVRKNSIDGFFSKIGEKVGASPKETRQAFLKARQFFSTFQKDWMDRVNHLPSRQLFNLEVPTSYGEKKSFSLRVALIGHPYNLFDMDINKDIITLIKSLGMEVITSDHLSEEEVDRQISNLSKEIYWSSGREIMGSLLHFLSGGVDGVVFVTSFKCGIDALLQEFIKRKLKLQGGTSVPLITLSFDEHTGREGLTTRLEAFRDVMEQRKTKISSEY